MAKILLADDNEYTLYILGRILRKNYFEVNECKDGIETLEVVKTFKPDLILLDIRMPRMDGYETCARLKSDELTRNIPIIIQTATAADISDKIRGFNLGVTDYVVFPVNFDELLARINTQLRIRELEKELRESEKLKAINEIVLTIHHEINNPLAVIQGWTQMLLMNKSLDKKTIDSLENIEKSALRINEVVKKLTRITNTAKSVKPHIFYGGASMIDAEQSYIYKGDDD